MNNNELIAIVGESGTGKTAALRTLDPTTTFIISTTGKRPGFKGSKKAYKEINKGKDGKIEGNFFTSSDPDAIVKMVKIINKMLTNINVLVIDDFQYVMGFEAMNRATEKSYDKHTDIAQHAFNVLQESMVSRSDLKIIICTHSEKVETDNGTKIKMKTIGKMLDNVITMEGLFTYVLHTKAEPNLEGVMEYKFITNNDGMHLAKSPMGCFEELEIDNDMKYVIDKIKEFDGDDL